MSFTLNNSPFLHLTSDLLAKQGGISHMYTTCHGGVSTGSHSSLSFRYTEGDPLLVEENFNIVAHALGGSYQNIVRTQQVHKSRVEQVSDGHGFRIVAPDNDGLITNLPNTILAGFYADCQVIFYYDPQHHACGVAHSGWRGTVLDISKTLIEKMRAAYGTDPSRLLCTIGPSICQNCFECDSDVPQAVLDSFGKDASVFIEHRPSTGKYHLDINGITKHRLLKSGVLESNIDICTLCTYCQGDDLFWSHRKVGTSRGVHGGFIMLK